VLGGGAFALSALYRAQTVSLLEEDLDATLVTLSRAVEYSPEGRLVTNDARLPADRRYEIPLSGRYWAIVALEADGTSGRDERPSSLWDSDPPIPAGLRARAMATPGASVFANAEGPNGETLRVGVRVIRLETGDKQVLLMAAADRYVTDQGAQRFLLLLGGAMIALAAGVLVALVVQIRLVLNPLHRVQADVADVREGQRTRLHTDYPSEVAPLAEEVNKLLDHNEAVVERAQTHVGNLAHALKTPLAVLRNEAVGDSALDGVVRRQTAAMLSSVEHYLERARAAARAQTRGVRTPIGPVVDALVRLLNRLFVEKGVLVDGDIPSGEVFRGEKQDLEEMLGNLMENACKWAASRVEVTGEIVDDDCIALHIDDDGPGLDADECEQALRRGVRLDESAPGTGLGLSIVKELAELHTGKLRLARSPLGGLRATLSLPRR